LKTKLDQLHIYNLLKQYSCVLTGLVEWKN